MSVLNINFNWETLVNERFKDLVKNEDRYLILYGGRGSSKSNFIAKKLIKDCLTEKYFRCILVRDTYNTIKDSQYQTIKDIIEEWGLSNYFIFKIQPLEIICKINGNKFFARGMDDAKKVKSVKDPTTVWYEEEIPREEDFITISTSIRTQKARFLQEVFTINPETKEDYIDNHFYKRFFYGHSDLSFSSETEIETDEGEKYLSKYTIHHSTYKDNKFLDPSLKVFLEGLKKSNPYYYNVYTLGLWGKKNIENRFWKSFDIGLNVSEEFYYDCNSPIHVSFDFNVNPYVTVIIFQLIHGVIYQIDELLCKNPNNTTIKACNAFLSRYHRHTGGVYIYGDPSGKSESTRQETGTNEYTTIMERLKELKPIQRTMNVAPNVKNSGAFVNDLFSNNVHSKQLRILSKCPISIQDYMYLQEDNEGGTLKRMVKDKETGISYEQYGHISDAMRYFVIKYLEKEYNDYLNPKKSVNIATISRLRSKNSF